MVLAHNLIFHLRTKYINIQHYDVCDEMDLKKINLLYIQTDQIIANGLTKALIYIKFYSFIKQIEII